MEKTILIVEDYDDARCFMKLVVESYGYIVIEAANGIEALKIFADNLPDMILMDIAMPGMDGLTTTRNIRNGKYGREIPIVAVTGQGGEVYDKAIAAGCNAMLEKPVDLDSLETVIRQYLEV